MKLVRYGEVGFEKPGIMDGDTLRDLSGVIDDIDGSTIGEDSLNKIRDINLNTLPAVNGAPRIGPCVGSIGKFMCIGLNFKDHAIETGNPFPDHPILFMKANSAIVGPNDDTLIPRGSTKTDWEVELGVVIGKSAKYVSKENALDYVAGYCVINDVSERDFQLNLTGTWTKGKSCDTFGPTGPWLVTRDEVADVNNLAMTLDVNGKRMQDGNTSRMKPPTYLKSGDIVELEIESLGKQRQEVRADA
jgi:2-keto-4-pentenoate hydratase/2-oxohepta-3-ene-1,7-dioic acid hydratase in catechol pathway